MLKLFLDCRIEAKSCLSFACAAHDDMYLTLLVFLPLTLCPLCTCLNTQDGGGEFSFDEEDEGDVKVDDEVDKDIFLVVQVSSSQLYFLSYPLCVCVCVRARVLLLFIQVSSFPTVTCPLSIYSSLLLLLLLLIMHSNFFNSWYLFCIQSFSFPNAYGNVGWIVSVETVLRNVL